MTDSVTVNAAGDVQIPLYTVSPFKNMTIGSSSTHCIGDEFLCRRLSIGFTVICNSGAVAEDTFRFLCVTDTEASRTTTIDSLSTGTMVSLFHSDFYSKYGVHCQFYSHAVPERYKVHLDQLRTCRVDGANVGMDCGKFVIELDDVRVRAPGASTVATSSYNSVVNNQVYLCFLFNTSALTLGNPDLPVSNYEVEVTTTVEYWTP